MKQIACICFSLGIFFLVSCDAINPSACTLQFEIISIEVTGGTLDQTFTIQKDNNDTVLTNAQPFTGSFYTVLDDSFQEELEGKQVEYRFVGLQQGSVVVDEDFVIEADVCHVQKVSGTAKVDL